MSSILEQAELYRNFRPPKDYSRQPLSRNCPEWRHRKLCHLPRWERRRDLARRQPLDSWL